MNRPSATPAPKLVAFVHINRKTFRIGLSASEVAQDKQANSDQEKQTGDAWSAGASRSDQKDYSDEPLILRVCHFFFLFRHS